MENTGNNSSKMSQKIGGRSPTPSLAEPTALLADHVHKAGDALFNIQKALVSKRKIPKAIVTQFKQGKQVFKTECESIRQLIQASYRHAADYATSSQRAPNDRAQSARRCFLSAKAVQQEAMEICRVYDTVVVDFQRQNDTLAGYLHSGNNGHSGPTKACEAVQNSKDPLKLLTTSLECVQLSLKRIKTFWDNHVNFLTLLMTRQTNYPSPGGEAKEVLDLWTGYQRILLQSSSSLLQSIQLMSNDPVIPTPQKSRFRRPHISHRSSSEVSNTSESDISSDDSSGSPEVPSEKSHVGLGRRAQKIFRAILHL